jgi:translocation protein SEC63
MSLLKHPDKNPENPLAVQEFIRLTKAYNILTDETSRENFRKYGNPDGPGGSYNVAIAMPKFLLEKENQIPVLLTAFFILLVVIPGTVYINFADGTKKDEGGILLENKRIFGPQINENLIYKQLPLLMSQAIEFQQLKSSGAAEKKLLARIKDNDKIADLMPKTMSKRTASLNLKPMLLILAHMMRNDIAKDPIFDESLEVIRKLGPQVLGLLGTITQELQKMHAQG